MNEALLVQGLIDDAFNRMEKTIQMVYWLGFGQGATAASIGLIVLFVLVLFGRRS